MSDRPIPAGSPPTPTGPLPRTAPVAPPPKPPEVKPASAAPAPGKPAAPPKDSTSANGTGALDEHMGQRGQHDIPAPSGGAKAQGGIPTSSVPAASAAQAAARAGEAAETTSSITEVLDKERFASVPEGFKAADDAFHGKPAAPTTPTAAPSRAARAVQALGPIAAAAKTASAMAALAKAIGTVPKNAEEAKARDLQVLTALADIGNGLAGMASFMKDLPPAAQKMLEKFGGITGAATSVIKLAEMYKEMTSQPGKATAMQMMKFGIETANFVGNVATAVGTLVPAVPAILGAGRALTLLSAGANLGVMAYENREIVGAAAQNAVTKDGWKDIYDYWTGRGLQARG